ncbi:MAG: hypothetical protein C0404_01910 [Verrucomicrobia bacterium]|nr:hypothetical protein [Verrucomicrobiota bacterium]
MKSWIIAAIALLTGLVIGGWAPRSDLRIAKEELENTKKMLNSKGRGTSNLNGITQLIGIEDRSRRDRKADRTVGSPTTVKGDKPAGTNQVALPDPADSSNTNSTVLSAATGTVHAAGAAASTAGKSNEETAEQRDKRSMKDSIDEAIELWKTRSDIARTTFINNLGLSPEEAVKFDVTVQAMNIRIGHGIQKLADNIKTNDYIGEESFVRLGNELTGAIVQGYSDLDRGMPRNWRATTGNEFSLMDFVDPNVAKPLIQVEDKLNSVNFGRRMQENPGENRRRGRHDRSVEIKVQ